MTSFPYGKPAVVFVLVIRGYAVQIYSEIYVFCYDIRIQLLTVIIVN